MIAALKAAQMAAGVRSSTSWSPKIANRSEHPVARWCSETAPQLELADDYDDEMDRAL